MAFPSNVIDDILEAKAYLSKINSGVITDRKNGCVDCGCSDIYKCLSRLLFSLDADALVGNFTESANTNYLIMINLIGSIVFSPVYSVVSFGYSITDPFGSEEFATLSFNENVVDNSLEYSLVLNDDFNLKYLVIKEDDSQPAKTVWQNTVFYNEGIIPDSKMRASVVKAGFRYYISRVPFAIDADVKTITLKTS